MNNRTNVRRNHYIIILLAACALLTAGHLLPASAADEEPPARTAIQILRPLEGPGYIYRLWSNGDVDYCWPDTKEVDGSWHPIGR